MQATTTIPPTSSGTPQVDGATQGAVRRALAEIGELTSFSARVVKAFPGVPRFSSEVMRHAANLVTGTTGLLLVMSLFGGITLGNFVFFLLRTIGASDFVGAMTGLASPRVMCLIMFGYTFTAKVCTGFVAEIGAMRVNEEIDAYEAEALPPERFIIGTRLAGVLLYLPIATAVCLVGVVIGEWLSVCVILEGLSSGAFFSRNWDVQTVSDQIYVLITVTAMGLSTALVACFYGYRTKGGPAEVGAAAARSLLVNIFLVHLVGGLCVILLWGSELRLGFGG